MRVDADNKSGGLDGEPKAKRQRPRLRHEPTFVSGTSSEFLGKKPLPRSVQRRSVVFVHGPPGVGKTSVALHILGGGALVLGDDTLMTALAHRVRYRAWPETVEEAAAVVLDGPCFLHRRPSVLRAIQDLLSRRAQAQRRTVVCEAADGSPLTCLMDAVEIEHRASIVLRFPVGRGRRRYATQICDERNLHGDWAQRLADLRPWSYRAVESLAAEAAVIGGEPTTGPHARAPHVMGPNGTGPKRSSRRSR